MKLWVFAAGAAMVLATAWGCGPSGPIPIHGMVTLDGAPLERGRIEFEPAGDEGPLGAASIVDGKYEAAVMPGKKLLRVTGGKVVGRRPFSESSATAMIEDIKPLVPPAYNTASTLQCDVSPGQDSYDFELKTKP